MIPDPKRVGQSGRPIIRSALDRSSFNAIAATSGGRYLELDRDSDVAIANQIIDAARRRSVAVAPEPAMEPMYWPFLLAAACAVVTGLLFLRDRSELWIQALGAGLVLAAVSAFLR